MIPRRFVLVCPLFVSAALAGAQDDKPEPVAGKAGTVQDFTYTTTPQADLSIHVHFPKDWKPADTRPGMVFFFGGGWTSGNVRQFVPQAEYFATRGMVTARADYRVASRHQTTPEKCVEDCKNAVRWLRRHAAELGIDPDRIVASGGSAGGHTAAATGIVPGFENEREQFSSKANLLVLFNPVMNTENIGRGMSPEMSIELSPNHHLAKDAPPMILFFGTTDRLIRTAEETVSKARPLGLTAELWTAEGQAHGFFNKEPWRERTMALADKFLARHGYLEGEPTVLPTDGAQMTLAELSPEN